MNIVVELRAASLQISLRGFALQLRFRGIDSAREVIAHFAIV